MDRLRSLRRTTNQDEMLSKNKPFPRDVPHRQKKLPRKKHLTYEKAFPFIVLIPPLNLVPPKRYSITSKNPLIRP